MSDPQTTAEYQPTRLGAGATTHLFLMLCVLAVGAFGAWSWYGKLDIVSDAVGEVVPSSQIKSIQHLEGGIVQEILIREGDTVEAGQELVVLERTASGADVQELGVRMMALQVDIARHEAELKRAKRVSYPKSIVKSQKTLIAQANQRFKNRISRINNLVASQQQMVTQRREEGREIKARINKRRKSLVFLKEQIAISDELMKEDLTNRMLHLNLLKERTEQEGGIAEDLAAQKRIASSIIEARARVNTLRTSFNEEVRAELDDKRRSLKEFAERMGRLEDNLARTVLRSPVRGVVQTLHVATLGGVVRSGDTVVDIVPAGDKLVIEAKLPAQDVGYVAPGQLAMVTLASGDAIRFGRLKGRVMSISPDTLVTKDNVPYYKVRVETERDYFERRSARYSLVPGVQVICSIQTGRRSVLEYILDPFLGAFRAAMQER
ncbi:MAG: HlyD family type I secretion periplasmic adaptor subunit [Alphaproteobacteria bacterium]|jgi:membrane fusion protein, adhesin transport system|nr:HlyD family type I secretion periplasmic adaptor subunit [Alphaproteobacteria bacterium]MBT4084557.1 HlyD family type I secretion periplasmic adaptor subunit [Alphaproteobacteria bacterium]MBT4544604.1 HlyD family type I secretion periplasmic adaptor subunit [Alphaproteobacteria bacterium]MBT7745751.1 HlyD family type I secretion periplasmic adaptor subunit [Alphaproteobacteria bacterium]